MSRSIPRLLYPNHPHPHRLRPLRQPRIERRQRVAAQRGERQVERVGGAQDRIEKLTVANLVAPALRLPAKAGAQDKLPVGQAGA